VHGLETLAAVTPRGIIPAVPRDLILPVLWAGLLNAAAWAVGRSLLVRICPERRGIPGLGEAGHVLAALLGFAALAFVALALGLIGFLQRPLLALGTLGAGAWGLVAISRAVAGWRPRLRPADLPTIAAGLFLATFVLAGLSPMLQHDDASYHLLLPRLYLDEGVIPALPFLLFANMPHVVEVLWTWGLACGDYTAVKLLPLGFVGWTLAGLWGHTARRAGRLGAGLLLVAFMASKSLQWHLGLAYVEPVLGAYLLGAALALVAWWRTGNRGDLRLVGLLGGVAAAGKYTAWFFAAVLVAAALGRLAWRRPPGAWRAAGALTLWTALPVAPWLVKNAVVTGNPVYPNLWNLLGGPGWSAVQSHHLWQVTRLPGSDLPGGLVGFLRLPWDLAVRDHVFDAPSVSLALLALALVAPFCRELRPDERLLTLLPLPGLALWWLVMSHGRYLVAWLAVVALAAAVALRRLGRSPRGRALLIVAVTGAALTQLAAHRYPWRPQLEVLVRPRAELLARNPSLPLARALAGLVPSHGVVLGMWENRFFFLSRRVEADASYEAPSGLARLRAAGDPARFAAALSAGGVTHVVIHARQLQRYLDNAYGWDLVDPGIYPAAALERDRELLRRFVGEQLTLVGELGPWGIFVLQPPARSAGIDDRAEGDLSAPP
jgi:hypothetical protein